MIHPSPVTTPANRPHQFMTRTCSQYDTGLQHGASRIPRDGKDEPAGKRAEAASDGDPVNIRTHPHGEAFLARAYGVKPRRYASEKIHS